MPAQHTFDYVLSVVLLKKYVPNESVINHRAYPVMGEPRVMDTDMHSEKTSFQFFPSPFTHHGIPF
jgi:hypothetical protein